MFLLSFLSLNVEGRNSIPDFANVTSQTSHTHKFVLFHLVIISKIFLNPYPIPDFKNTPEFTHR